MVDYNYYYDIVDAMCGICLILKVAIQSHRFLFDFFQDYGHSPDAVVLPLNEHIMHN